MKIADLPAQEKNARILPLPKKGLRFVAQTR